MNKSNYILHQIFMCQTENGFEYPGIAQSIGHKKAFGAKIEELYGWVDCAIRTGHITNHLYIVSNEEPKDGDWCYNGKDYFVFIFDETAPRVGAKIIATTNPNMNLPKIDIRFVDDVYVKSYNKQNIIVEVLVEYDKESGKLYTDSNNYIYIKPQNKSINESLKAQYIAVFNDGEYKNVIVVEAEDIDDADSKLKEKGWQGWSSLKPIEFDESGICIAINGLK
ncbi:MAG: hypothetical protein AABY15_02965 [Nanoarchaeota archaeon]